MSPLARAFLAGSLVLACACTDPVDQAAKKRIFSPEDPPKAVASASEPLAPDQAGGNPALARRILRMGAAETTERLGPHKYAATVSFEWSGAGRAAKLTEHRSLVAGAGGVSGDFHGVVDNSRDQGLEVMRIHGQVFARSRYGKFRQRLRDRGMAEREREEIYAAVRDADELLQGRIQLRPLGPTTHLGRSALKFDLALGPPVAEEARQNLPPLVVPKGGVDETTRRRQRFFEKRVPTAISGELWVDTETAVILKASIDGQLSVPSEEGEAKLHLKVDAALSDLGKAPPLAAPEGYLPDQDKPEGIADALERFGISRAGGKADAGVAEDLPDEN